MNIRLLNTLALLALVALPAAQAQDARKAADNPRAVLPHNRRVDVLKRADELLQVVPAGSAELTADLPDPFYPGTKRPKDKKPGVEADARLVIPDEQLLARAAELIRPQGTFVMGAEAFIQLDGKRYKVGDTISVNVDGLGVQVTVSSIQRNSYTLRLNDKELRRDFK